MVVLKKIRAATLVESMVASVIIVLVFVIASMSLNNVFKNMVNSNDSALQNRIDELTYFAENKKLSIPFYEETDQWEITIESIKDKTLLSSVNKSNAKTKTDTIH